MVIRKEPLGPDAETRARQEVAMLERSPGVAGGDAAGAGAAVSGSFVLEDAGGASLAGMAKPLPVDEPFSPQRRRAAAESVAYPAALRHRVG